MLRYARFRRYTAVRREVGSPSGPEHSGGGGLHHAVIGEPSPSR
jgi:hypothetical protein